MKTLNLVAGALCAVAFGTDVAMGMYGWAIVNAGLSIWNFYLGLDA